MRGVLCLLFLFLSPLFSKDESIPFSISPDSSIELRHGWESYFGSLLFEGVTQSENCFYLKRDKKFLDSSCTLLLNEAHPFLHGERGEAIQIPYSWKESPLNQEKTNRGTGTFVIEVNLPDENNIALYSQTEAFYSAYRIWGETDISFELLYSRGVVNANASLEIPILSPIFFTYRNARWKKILVEVSNANYNRDVFWTPLVLGNAQTLEMEKSFHNYREMLIAGILIMTGLYHLIIYSLRKQLKATFWFGNLCLFFSLRVLIMNRTLEQFFPNHLYFDHLLKLEYIGLVIITSSMAMYFYYFFNQIPNLFLLAGMQIGNLIFALYFLFSNPYQTTSILFLLQINILVLIIYILIYLIQFSFSSVLETKKYARSLFLIYIIVCLCAIHDILMYQGYFRSIDLTGFGLSFFTIGQAYVIARMNSVAWSNSEYLSKKLEAEVEKQTHQLRAEKEKAEVALSDLRISQNLLSRAESKAAMTQISAHLAHEINNPLNYISNGNRVIQKNLEKLRSTLMEATDGDDSALEFFQYCNDLITKSFESLKDQSLGRTKITEMVSEIKAISGVDGFGLERISLASFLEDEVQKVREIHQKKNLKVTLSPEISSTLMISTNRYIFSRAIRTISSVFISRGAENFSFELSTMNDSEKNQIYFIEFLCENIQQEIDPGIFTEKQKESGVGIMDLKLIKQILNEVSININTHSKGNKQGFLLIISEIYGKTE